MDNLQELIDDLVLWLREKTQAAGAKGLVFGLSGGVDSALMAALAKRAFPHTSLGLIMPCHSHPSDEEDARLVAKSLDLRVEKVDLGPSYDSLLQALKLGSSQLAKSNIKPRLRMTSLYYYAQTLGYLVAGPTNKSEFIIGYFTKHGDSSVDLLPLVDFTKREIWEMSEYLAIPERIVRKIPSAGLWDSQTDEEEMGFSYDVLDLYIEAGIGKKDLVEKIKRLESISQHKRQYPPIYSREERMKKF